MCNNKEIENKIISCIMNELSDEFRENLVSGKLYESVILIMINYEKNKSLLDGIILDSERKKITIFDLKTTQKLWHFEDSMKQYDYCRQLRS